VSSLLAPAANADPSVQVPFKADSGDSCRRGVTVGTLTWPGIVIRPTVVVDGYLADDYLTPCQSLDVYYSVATFTAYSGKTVVDTESRKADNERVTFRFELADSDGVDFIDRVVVQVCRHTNLSPPDYCGTAQEYKHP